MNDDEHHPHPRALPGQTVPEAERDAVRARRDDGTDGTVVSEKDTHTRRQSTPDSSYQNYLFGRAGSDEQPAWSDSTAGRAAIRLVSRGIVGAAFFIIGGRIARQQLLGYSEADWKWDSAKPLQGLAKFIDLTAGRAVKSGIRTVARITRTPQEAEMIAQNALTFRQSRSFDVIKNGAWTSEKGRSYGADVVSFTFDFASASVGDAMTRNIIQAFDPNIKKSWLVNDAGAPAKRGEHKHIVWSEAVKAFGRSSWRIFSKNQGEDWAAAIPYAFQMKFQRQFLSKIFNNRFEGHQIVFDNNWNGGAYKVDQTGKIIGDYQLAGAIDLHARFVGYNWYTLMFREGYDRIANSLAKWKEGGFAIHAPQLPTHFNPITTPIDAAAHTMRYVTKSFIKANLYMNAAVIPFWIMRTSQSKWRGRYYINEGNMQNGASASVGDFTNVWQGGGLAPFAKSNYDHYKTDSVLDRFEKRFSQGMNWIGEKQFRLGNKASGFGDALDKRGLFPRSSWMNELLTHDIRRPWEPITPELVTKGRRLIMHEFTDASLAYTPYMFAKAEFGLRVDDTKGDGTPGQMDKAIYRFMDNVASFNLKGTGRSIKEIWQLGTHFERDLTVREGGVADNKLATTSPATKVEANSVNLNRGTLRQSAHGHAQLETADDAAQADDNTWVQSVVGRQVNPAHIHTASTTRH